MPPHLGSSRGDAECDSQTVRMSVGCPHCHKNVKFSLIVHHPDDDIDDGEFIDAKNKGFANKEKESKVPVKQIANDRQHKTDSSYELFYSEPSQENISADTELSENEDPPIIIKNEPRETGFDDEISDNFDDKKNSNFMDFVPVSSPKPAFNSNIFSSLISNDMSSSPRGSASKSPRGKSYLQSRYKSPFIRFPLKPKRASLPTPTKPVGYSLLDSSYDDAELPCNTSNNYMFEPECVPLDSPAEPMTSSINDPVNAVSATQSKSLPGMDGTEFNDDAAAAGTSLEGFFIDINKRKDKCRFPCNICNKTFSRRHHVYRHISSVHGKKEYRCRLCNIIFTRKDSLLRHNLVKHSEEPHLQENASRSTAEVFTSLLM